MTDPYENLANAIVASAAKEYMSVLKILKKSPTNENAKKTMTECERFFRSFCVPPFCVYPFGSTHIRSKTTIYPVIS